MISRVAESCCWMHRYVERAENAARLLSVNRSFLLDVDLPRHDQWWPVVMVTGEQDRIKEVLEPGSLEDGEQIQEYLAWNPDNPVSIYSSIRWARENARTIREVISLETWETVNSFWHWLKSGPGRRLYREDPDAYFRRVKEFAAMFQGVCHNTMMHEASFDFMRLGMLLERAGWTARIVDVKHHMLGPLKSAETVGPLESAQAMALLRSCSATQPFLKHVQKAPTPRRVVEFLLLAESFPRSVLHCLVRARNFLGRVRPESRATGDRSAALLDTLVGDLSTRTAEDIFERGLHEEITRIIDSTTEVCNAIHDDYFDPDFKHASTMSQSQVQ